MPSEMKSRILLTGGNGRVGRALFWLLPQLGDVVGLGREQLDLLKPREIGRVMRDTRPNVILNAAASRRLTKTEKEEAVAVPSIRKPAVMMRSKENWRRIGAPLVNLPVPRIVPLDVPNALDQADWWPFPISFRFGMGAGLIE